MSDVDRMGAIPDEDRLPWLEAVEDEDRRGGSGAGTLVAALIAALVALGLVVGGIFWLRDRGREATGGGEGELIAAPAGPYKQKPENPGGMKVEGQGDAAYAASAGADVNASVDIAALPEQPVAGPGSKTADAGQETTAAKPAGPAPAKPTATKPVEQTAAAKAEPSKPATGGAIQLGAFSSEAKANAAWKAMAARFAYLKPLTSSVTSVSSNGHTLYRLRAAAGSEAKTVCAKLKVAGETCAVIG